MSRTANLAPDIAFMYRALREAVCGDAISPAFQPIVHLDTREVSSFEVLARWTDEVLGSVPPSIFIPMAEKSGLIGDLTTMLIGSACSAALECEGDFRLAINISPLHFQQGEMPDLFEDAVIASGFPLARTQIEITESAVIEDAEAARETIDQLRRKGVRIVLDDFGTGFSSLTRLQALPFDKIKIDSSFVRTMCEARDSQEIVSAVIGLGHSLGMPVVAEGVETEEQAHMLARLGCDLGQGWLFGKPVPKSALSSILRVRGQRCQDTLPTYLSTNQRLAQLEAVYAVAPVGLCFIDKNRCLMKANQQFARVVGRDIAACVGRPLDEVLPSAAVQLERDFLSLTSGDHTSSCCVRLSDACASVQIKLAAVRDANGLLIGFSLAIVE